MVNLSFTHLIFICIVIIGALWLSYYNIEKLHKEYIKLDQTFRQQNIRLEHMESLCSSISTSLLEKAQKEEAMEQEVQAQRNNQEEERLSQNMEKFIQDNENNDLLKDLVNMNVDELSIHSDNEENDINNNGIDEKFIENIIDKYEEQNDMVTKDDDVIDDEDVSLTSSKEKVVEKKKKDKSKKEKKKKKLVEDKKIVQLEENDEKAEEYYEEEIDFNNLTVSELREKLQSINAPTRGSKSELIDRLTQIKNINVVC